MLRLKSSLISHPFKNRDRVTIIGDILEIVKDSRDGSRKTYIMQNAKLNYIQMMKYLNYLLNCGLLAVTERKTYVITEKGSRFMQLIEIQKTAAQLR